MKPNCFDTFFKISYLFWPKNKWFGVILGWEGI